MSIRSQLRLEFGENIIISETRAMQPYTGLNNDGGVVLPGYTGLNHDGGVVLPGYTGLNNDGALLSQALSFFLSLHTSELERCFTWSVAAQIRANSTNNTRNQ